MYSKKNIDGMQLIDVKEWVTLDEAVDYLSSLCDCVKFYKRDLLKRAIDGSLTISIYLKKMTRSRGCQIISKDDLECDKFDCVDEYGFVKKYYWKSEDKYIKPINSLVMTSLEGCHDLIMAGGVPHHLNDMITKSCGLSRPDPINGIQTEVLIGTPGVIVKNENGNLYELMTLSPFSCESIDENRFRLRLGMHGKCEYHSMMKLPLHESPLVIRANELKKIENMLMIQGDVCSCENGSYSDRIRDSREKPLSTRGEIAKFFDCSIPSVRNYIRNENLPIHKKDNGRIYAFPSELIEWLNKRPKRKEKRKKRNKK